MTIVTERLKKYSKKFNYKIRTRYFSMYNDSPEIKKILQYSMKGGKRMRPAIVNEIIRILNRSKLKEKRIDSSDIAIMNELIHSSSLIIDDLPCMDNDDLRRGKPTIHKKYGLLGAKMISTLLISDAYTILYRLFDTIKEKEIYTKMECEERMLLLLDNLTKNIGIEGAAYGQYLDLLPTYSLEFQEEVLGDEIKRYTTSENIQEIIDKKTGVIFEISFISAYLLAGGSLEHIERVQQAAHCFGTAFQIYDDILDVDKDRLRIVNGLTSNYVLCFGKEQSNLMLRKSIYQFRTIMIELGLYSSFFNELGLSLLQQTLFITTK